MRFLAVDLPQPLLVMHSSEYSYDAGYQRNINVIESGQTGYYVRIKYAAVAMALASKT